MGNARPLAVGDVVHGFARGAFGRDHYECVRIEAAGRDWIVARDVDGHPCFASGERSLRHLITVRDEDGCTEDKCPLVQPGDGLTIPGGW